MNKIVTIIISAYNKVQYIERCVHSLMGKNVNKSEIIIVNDGSTDETSAIALQIYPDRQRKNTLFIVPGKTDIIFGCL